MNGKGQFEFVAESDWLKLDDESQARLTYRVMMHLLRRSRAQVAYNTMASFLGGIVGGVGASIALLECLARFVK